MQQISGGSTILLTPYFNALERHERDLDRLPKTNFKVKPTSIPIASSRISPPRARMFRKRVSKVPEYSDGSFVVI
jgi:hypothetical protein